MARKDGIFPEDSQLVGRDGEGDGKVYRMDFPDGWGTMTAHAAVSYTHLDVYKRQRPCWSA